MGKSERTVGAFVVSLLLAAPAFAQCALQWQPASVTGRVYATCTLPNGDLLVGGAFTQIEGAPIANLARYDGSSWAPIGGGAVVGVVEEISVLANGDVVVFGPTSIGGLPVQGLAIWDGATWLAHPAGPLPSPAPTYGLEYCAMPNGDIVIAYGQSTGPTNTDILIERWSGAGWQTIGVGTGSSSSSPNPTVVDLDVLPTGELVALGTWQRVGPTTTTAIWNELMTFDGTTWTTLHQIVNPLAFRVDGRGRGVLVTSSIVQLWDGVDFLPAGGSFAGSGVRTAVALPDDDVVCAGNFGPGWPQIPPAIGAERFDRATAVSTSLGIEVGAAGGGAFVDHLALHESGRIAVFGSFQTAGGVAANNFAWLVTGCAAGAAAVPTGCVGPVGPMSLTATQAPWIGGTYTSRTTAFAASSFPVHVLGFSQVTLPFAGTIPQALPNCDLLSSAELVELGQPNAVGVATFSFAIPDVPALVGGTLTQQTLQLGFGAGGAFTSLSGSNGLVLTIGAF